jgi:carbamate kinase
MRIVIALGGNALIRRGGPTDMDTQARNVARAAVAIAGVAARHEVIVTHGNGPQIGLLALLDAFAPGSHRSPLDLLGAESDGMIGYLLERELMNALGHSRVATLLTQVEVSRADPAFEQPTKFVGPMCAEAEARRLAAEHGWRIARDGDGWRRVVPSPEPRRIIASEAIRMLLREGFLTVCAGGGGIPVALSATNRLEGVECVVDKDLTSALVATTLEADVLLMLTDVDAVYEDFGKPEARPIRAATPGSLRARVFPAGSMGPKVEAACRFVTAPGRRACIGSLDAVADLLAGRAGTCVTAD